MIFADGEFSPNPAPLSPSIRTDGSDTSRPASTGGATFVSVPFSNLPNIYTKKSMLSGGALRYLKNSQNPDGSWGRDEGQCKATALAFIAFTRHMKTGGPGSKYEETIEKARAWLRKATPLTDEDRLALVIAVAGLYTNKRGSRTPDKGAGAGDGRKLNSLLEGIQNPKDSAWFDFFAISALPEDVKRPVWSVNNAALQKKYRDKSDTSALSTEDDYLNLYLVTVAKWRNEQTRVSHTKALTQALAERQDERGAFSTSNGNDTLAATALSAMCFSLDYIIADRFFSSSTETPEK